MFRALGPGSSKQPTEIAENRQETALEETGEVIELSEKYLEGFFQWCDGISQSLDSHTAEMTGSMPQRETATTMD